MEYPHVTLCGHQSFFRIDEKMRPVKLQKIVKGYESSQNGYLFDVHLSYKLKQIISQYSAGKPTLVSALLIFLLYLKGIWHVLFTNICFQVFCSTRKSVISTAEVIVKTLTFSLPQSQKIQLSKMCEQIADKKVRGTKGTSFYIVFENFVFDF